MQYFSDYSKFNNENKPYILLFNEINFLNQPNKVYFNSFLDKSTIITGESEKKKTQITSDFINFLFHQIEDKHIYIIDMAPERFVWKNKNIGGKITDFLTNLELNPNVSYYEFEKILPPRCNAKSSDEVIIASESNYKKIHPKLKNISEIVNNYLKQRKKTMQFVFIVNDLSIYFHRGPIDIILKLLKKQKSNKNVTIFMNAYEGKYLINDYGSNISNIEKTKINEIKKYIDFSIKLV